jgi:hypothetical protein
MRNRWIGLGLVLCFGVAMTSNSVQAQPLYDVPGNASFTTPVLGHDRPESGGFYTALEFVLLHQSRQIGSQVVGVRGLIDSTGLISSTVQRQFIVSATGAVTPILTTVRGIPGTFLGSRTIALSTDNLGRTTYEPGTRLTLGYRFDDGFSLSLSYMHLFDAKYNASASLVPPFFRNVLNSPAVRNPNGDPPATGTITLADSYVTAAVFNFPTNYAGPQVKTQFDTNTTDEDGNNPAGLTYGIWNAASNMDILLTQRFDNADITGRMPVYATDYSRTYALAGARFSWFFERFRWRTTSLDINGGGGPQDVAVYSNTLSQRMYGAFLGAGNEIYLTEGFAASVDTTGALLLNIVKQRAKYELGDRSTQAKRSRNFFTVVPNANIAGNLWWYPIPNVQLRLGYQGQFYFNTKYMDKPISFNYGAIDPAYETKFLRFVHGINFGLGLTF